MRERILVVDDEEIFLREVKFYLEQQRFYVEVATDGESALKIVQESSWDILFLDLALPTIGGLEVLKNVVAKSPEVVVVIMTAYGSIESSVQALKLGAFDYLQKPLRNKEIDLCLHKIKEHRRLTQENQVLKQIIKDEQQAQHIITKSPKMKRVLEQVEKLSSSDTTVLITGESGVGKELVAQLIHRKSSRIDRLFLPVNMSAIPPTLAESQLFGHVKGAFTGSERNHKGVFEKAEGGTLFLDEIGDVPIELQARLLRTIEEQEIFPLGAEKPIKADFRLVSATNKNLRSMVLENSFRKDLFFRLNVFQIEVPPLRARKEDIHPLSMHFLSCFQQQMKKKVAGIQENVFRLFETYLWPGNIRELKNVIERAVIMVDEGAWIEKAHLPSLLPDYTELPSLKLKDVLGNAEKQHIEMVLDICGANKEEAAKMLGLSIATLYRRLEKHQLLSSEMDEEKKGS